MSKFYQEKVTAIHHWTDHLFSFTATRDPGLRFRSGQFVMLGLEVDGRPLMRAYSVASPHYADEIEFFSIKVPDGPLTSRLQHLNVGDEVLISRKPTGTLVLDDLLPGKRLFLFSTGTGLAPFISLLQDPETYERFEQVILLHGVRYEKDLAYREFFTQELPNNEFLGELVQQQLVYYPCVSREPFKHQGRITSLIENEQFYRDTGLEPLNPATDRAMICGSTAMLHDIKDMLEARNFKISPRMGEMGDFVIERAFAD
ncbi:ferredoxin-NADP reductase [Thiopseudomonas alkaliphila]|uniref:ferredoxin--NADP(+) reductase n=1 Tax=Thiopseudomonas alkaliphila TaxID=1697053 RepID=A0A0K1XBN3_9GAMM|nr:ferredoxin--NADP reductase [Thiopseudomonas alkaliphila]AKX44085.1 ferredoxin-NADP reductase [Thiopseudomonas alkaliphila]AKX46322.1 ferredoxin-NADP reductase [Thiopseudomonas alkaliphila]AKX49391.1 ferredoxin-NADP reductase [Thiopseudomonas alkaliphila]AKX50144.1 ferredoxin-NADP reductase [Thiopseudomonas alkaliphila]AKX52699.1 ferredoxin-NADP reductase [Thiopseudomonas alkaliphila]